MSKELTDYYDDFDEEYKLRECSQSSCGHYDTFNRCCWLSWRHKVEGDSCDYGFSTQPYGDFPLIVSVKAGDETK